MLNTLNWGGTPGGDCEAGAAIAPRAPGLALQVTADLLEEYTDGVWLVELAPLTDPALVPQPVASALGVRPLYPALRKSGLDGC